MRSSLNSVLDLHTLDLLSWKGHAVAEGELCHAAIGEISTGTFQKPKTSPMILHLFQSRIAGNYLAVACHGFCGTDRASPTWEVRAPEMRCIARLARRRAL